jgi:RNA polymerase sigma-70 factor (ECF subfamily)
VADRLTRFIDRDPAAVEDLYAEYGGAVFTVAISILHDRHLAADATQDTFVKAWRNAGSFDPTRDFGPWIYAIARNAAIDILRRRRGEDPSERVLDTAVFPAGIERVWETFEVRHAVDRLPTEERDVVRLTHLAGLTHVEAAEELGIPVGTVKSRSHRAHRRLAKWLGHMAESENRTADGVRIEDETYEP